MWLLALVACTLHATRTGLVVPAGDSLDLRGYQGEVHHLRLDADSEALRYLEGLGVVVEGRELGRTVYVRDWHMRDAGDGTAGFVGVLGAHGARLVIDDRNTGTRLFLDDSDVAALRPHVGKMVLLVGPVVGRGIIDVMAFRVLAPAVSR